MAAIWWDRIIQSCNQVVVDNLFLGKMENSIRHMSTLRQNFAGRLRYGAMKLLTSRTWRWFSTVVLTSLERPHWTTRTNVALATAVVCNLRRLGS